MLLNMLKKPAKRTGKQQICSKHKLFIVYQYYNYWAAEKSTNFRENFLRNSPNGPFQFGFCFENQL